MSTKTKVSSYRSGSPKFGTKPAEIDNTVITYQLSDEERMMYQMQTPAYYVELKEQGHTDEVAAGKMNVNTVKLNQLKHEWGFIGKKPAEMKAVLKKNAKKKQTSHQWPHAQKSKDNLSSLSSKEADLQKKLESADKESYRLRNYIAELESENDELKNQSGSVSKKDYERLENERKNLSDKLNQLRSSQEEKSNVDPEAYDVLKIQYQESQNTLENLKNQMKSLYNEIEYERNLNKQNQAVISNLYKRIKSLEQEEQKHESLSKYVLLLLQGSTS